MAAIFSTENPQVCMSTKIKKFQSQPLVTPAPIACDSLAEQSQIQKNTDISSEDKLYYLQLGQVVPSGLKEVEPPRRNERMFLQQEQMTSQGPVTRDIQANRQLHLHMRT